VTCPCGGSCPDVHVHDIDARVELELPPLSVLLGLKGNDRGE
jgi:hypothetical protein